MIHRRQEDQDTLVEHVDSGVWALAVLIAHLKEFIIATIDDIKASLDQLAVQESSEQVLAPGQVPVAQASLDEVAAKVQSLIDNPTPPAPPAA